MAKIPKDPTILYSFINTRLRDKRCDLTELCEELCIDREELCEKLAAVDFHYDPEKNQFL